MNDLKFAIRQLLKNPGFTAVAVLTLALGIGSTTLVFSLIQGVLLKPLPYSKPHKLAHLLSQRIDGTPRLPEIASAQWLEWKKESKSFEAISAYSWSFNFLILPDGSESLEGLWVTSDFFRVMGIQPKLGRTFTSEEYSSHPPEVVIIGHDLWTRRFNADPKILGQTLLLTRREKPLTIIGVMPPGVRFLPAPASAREPNYDLNAMVDYWLPETPLASQGKNPIWNVVGRLREGVTLDEARAELRGLAARQAQADRYFEDLTASAEQLTTEINREAQRLLLPLLGAVILVFFVACGNASGLLLARGLRRQHELAVRSALGAGRARLFRDELLESLVLALIGSGAGIAFANVGLSLLKSFAAQAVPRLDSVHIGWPVILFCLATALASAALAGILPAWRATLLNPSEGLKSGTRSSGIGRVERLILQTIAAGQLAITLALLVGAGLLARTIYNLAKAPLGFRTENILTMNVTDMKQLNFFQFHDLAISRISALPGVEKVAFAWGVPLTGNKWMTPIRIEGESTPAQSQDSLLIPSRSVTPEYFDLLGQKVLIGRNFPITHSVETNRIVIPLTAIVNEAMAKKYFASGNPVGRKLLIPGREEPLEVIGVVANARTESLIQTPEPELYFCMWEAMPFTKHLLVRTVSDPQIIAATVQRELLAIEPTIAIENVKTLGNIREESVATQTFAMRLIGAFAIMASALACIGIYGVLSLTVATRKREIAIRMALGAQRKVVLLSVLSGVARVVLTGALLGIPLAVVLSRGLGTLLFGVVASDLLTWCGMGLALVSIASLASWMPARRATNVDPMEALRRE